MAFTNSFSIPFFGSAEIAMDVVTGGVNDGKVSGSILNNQPVDPTSTDWNQITTSDEAKFIVNQFNGTIDRPLRFLDEEELLDAYDVKAKSIANQSIIEAENLIASAIPSAGGAIINQLASAVGRRSTKPLTSALAYPADIDKRQDYLQIDQYEYRPPQGGFGGGLKNPTRGTKKYEGTVILPMPKVSDSNGADWAKSDLNIFGVAATSTLGTIIPGGEGGVNKINPSGFFDSMKSQVGNVVDSAKVAGAMAGENLVGGKLGINLSPDQLLARSIGNIINPNAELLFQGPTLRNFTFSYIMVARNQQEGANIRRIIKFFKDGLAPKKLNAALLGTPNIFALKYSTKNGNKSVNKFKDMALQRFTVDYAPSGFWTAYDDSQPVAVKIQFEFTELQPIYNTDQNEFKGDNVGY